VQALLERLGPGLDVEGVNGDLPGNAYHFYRYSHKNILVVPDEADPNLDGLGRVLNVDLDGLRILGGLEGAERGGHGRVGQRRRCIEA
jgi:hypothetical protein